MALHTLSGPRDIPAMPVRGEASCLHLVIIYPAILPSLHTPAKLLTESLDCSRTVALKARFQKPFVRTTVFALQYQEVIRLSHCLCLTRVPWDFPGLHRVGQQTAECRAGMAAWLPSNWPGVKGICKTAKE